MEMGGNFCQILELGGTTIKGRRVAARFWKSRKAKLFRVPENLNTCGWNKLGIR